MVTKIKRELTMEERVARQMNLTGVTRIAYLAVTELVKQGRAEFLFLREDDVNDWWGKMIKKEKAARAVIEEEDRKQELRRIAMAKLTTEERKVLGLY